MIEFPGVDGLKSIDTKQADEMRLNENTGWCKVHMFQRLQAKWTAVSTSKVLLVPYSDHHVSRYHGWMRDPV